MSQDVCDHRLGVAQHFLCRNVQRLETLTCQPFVTRVVMRRTAGAIMRLAVDFDRELRFQAGKVENERSSRVLAPKAKAMLALSKFAPEKALGQSECSPQSARIAYGWGGASQHSA